MKLKKISLENIRSYKNAEIEFPEGSVILSGDIGSGKTSVLLAVEFALFGLQPGQKGSSLLRNGKDEGSVELEFEINEKNIIIKRGLKRGKSVTQSSSTLIINGDRKEMSTNELKNAVLSLLNYPPEFARRTNILYKFTVYTPQEEMKQIILESPEIRLNTLRYIFGIDKYRRIKENTSILTLKLREIIRNYEGQIKNLDEKKQQLESKKQEIKNLNKNLSEIETQFSERKKEVENKETELKEIDEKIKEKEKYERETEKTKIMLAGKQDMIANIIKDIENLNKQIIEAQKIKFDEQEFEEFNKHKQTFKKEVEEKNKQYLEILSQINSLEHETSKIERQKKQIALLKLCPTCFQNVDEEYKKNIINRFDDNVIKNINEIKKFVDIKNQAIKKIDEGNDKISEFDKKINEMSLIKIKLESLKEKEERLQSLEKQKQSNEKDTEMLASQIERLKEEVAKMKKYDIIYNEKNKELNEARNRETEVAIKLAENKKEIELGKREIENINKEITEKLKIKKKFQDLTELEQWLSEKFLSLISFTEQNVMAKLREEFSKLFNEWFNILVPEVFSVRLNEDFTPIIEQQDFELDYSFLSGGERTAIALAYRLALNQVINSLLARIKTKDLVILDEPTDGFSEKQLDKMRDVLNELNIGQLIIVSHEAKIEGFVESIIKFSKEDGVTRVEKG